MHLHSDYVPLHLHTEYSLLDGAIRIDELIAKASLMKMPAVAITDHGNLFGAVAFYRKAIKAGIKPIIGCEVYVAPKSRFDKSRSDVEEASFHLILLAKDISGYRNLVSLVSRAYTEGFYYKPRIDNDLLEQYSGGLIALSACMKGEVPYYLRHDMIDRARQTALLYKHILGPENFFIEVQDNGISEQYELNKKLISLSEELHIGIVATNDCHYLNKEDARAHDILLCIQTGKTVNDPKRLRFSSDGFYFKSPEEMNSAFRDIPSAILNTRAIAERCNVEFSLGANLLPKYEMADGQTPYAYLEKLAREGLNDKFDGSPPEAYQRRLNDELSVIKKVGYASYFLIVWDFVKYARGNGIPVGPGRGSAAGSLVSYSLGITEIDPIRYHLIFERFLNPERLSMPDIDVDFCKTKRPEVISYVSRKYGNDHVAQIITFGTMAARAAIRDVARAMDFPYHEADRLAKLVPEGTKITIQSALRLEPRIAELYDSNPNVKELLDIAVRLEGISRHASTHAAGVVISPMPITDIAPLYRNPTDGTITTQFDMKSVEKLGLVKFDLLGLKTLTIIEKALGYIKEKGTTLSLKDLPVNDKKTYELLSSGQTTGIFQLESRGMRELLQKMQPGRFEDLIALVALYRPGPIGSGMIDDFIKRKKGHVTVKYEIPSLKEILDETYGVILYQEQVMSIANRLANFTMGQADALRKAMGKKLPEEMEKHKEAFINGAGLNGIKEKRAERLFDLMAKFAEYGFNKSHSAAYAYLSYQTAYLKAHYPVEFIAATLSADIDNTDKVVKSIKECSSMEIAILPPDINLCGMEFTVIGNSIRFGIGAVKGVGTSAIEAILEARSDARFASLEDFLRRVDSRKVNKKVIEALVMAGAFDSLRKLDADKSPSIEELCLWRSKAMSMLSPNGGESSLSLFCPTGETKDDKGWDEAQLLRNEKSALGFFISGNPMTKFKKVLSGMNIKSTSELDELSDRQEVEVAGIVASIKKIRIRDKGEMMAYLSLEDDEGNVEVIVFPETLKNNPELLIKDTAIFVRGSIDRAEKGIKIVAKDIHSLNEKVAGNRNGRKVEIYIKASGDLTTVNASLKRLKELINNNSGDLPLYLRVRLEDKEALILTSYLINPDSTLINHVEDFLGKGSVRVI